MDSMPSPPSAVSLSLSLFPPSVMKECPGSGLSPSSAVARLFVVRAWVAGGFRLTQQASQTNLMQTQVQIFSTYRTWTCLKSSITPWLNTHQLMRVSKVAASLQMSMMKSHENIMCSTDFNQKSKLSERSVCKASFHGMACRRSLHITSGTGSDRAYLLTATLGHPTGISNSLESAVRQCTQTSWLSPKGLWNG